MILTTLLFLLWGVLGALWRRVFGGYLGLPRGSVCYPLSIPLAAPLWILLFQNFIWYVALPLSLIATVVILLFFVVSFYPKGKFVDNRDVILKYGPFGIGYVLAHNYWNDDWNTGSFIDGSNAVSEISLGFLLYVTIGISWFYVF